MSSVFLGNTGGETDLDDGTADIFVNSVKVSDLQPNLPVKTTPTKGLTSSLLNISDTANLQSALDNKTTLNFNHTTTPTIPPAGQITVYSKSDDKLYKLNSAGVESEIGSGGGGVQSKWKFNSAVSGNPASEYLRFDNATPASVLEIVMNTTDSNSIDQRPLLQTLARGDQLYLCNSDATNCKLYNIENNVDNTTFFDLTVALEAENAAANFTNDEVLTVVFYINQNPFDQSLNTNDSVEFNNLTITNLTKTNDIIPNVADASYIGSVNSEYKSIFLSEDVNAKGDVNCTAANIASQIGGSPPVLTMTHTGQSAFSSNHEIAFKDNTGSTVGSVSRVFGEMKVQNTGGSLGLVAPAMTIDSSVVQPVASNTTDLGTSAFKYRDLYLAGSAKVATVNVEGNTPTITLKDADSQATSANLSVLMTSNSNAECAKIQYNGAGDELLVRNVGSNNLRLETPQDILLSAPALKPDLTNNTDLGSTTAMFKNLYLSQDILCRNTNLLGTAPRMIMKDTNSPKETADIGIIMTDNVGFGQVCATILYQGASDQLLISNGGANDIRLDTPRDVIVDSTAVRPSLTNTTDLGTSSTKFKDIYAFGTANVDGLINTGALVCQQAGTPIVTLQDTASASASARHILQFTDNGLNPCADLKYDLGSLTLRNHGLGDMTLQSNADIVFGASVVKPANTGLIDLGSSSAKYKDAYLSGDALIDTSVKTPLIQDDTETVKLSLTTGLGSPILYPTAPATNFSSAAGTVTYSATQTIVANQPWRAFDQNKINSFWNGAVGRYSTVVNNGAYLGSVSTNGYLGEWISIEFPSQPTTNIESYRLYPAPYTTGLPGRQQPVSWKIFSSTDGITWTERDEQVNVSWVEAATPLFQEFTMTTPSNDQHWRMAVSRVKPNGGGSGLVQIMELEFYALGAPISTITATTDLMTLTGDLELAGTMNTLTPIGGKYSQTGGNATVANTTTQTSLVNSGAGTLVFQPSEWTAGATYHVKMSGTIDDDGKNEEVEIALQLGGATIHTTTFIDLDDIKGTFAWELEVDICYRGSNTFFTNSQFTYMKDANAGGYKGWAQSQSASITVSVPVTLSATAQWSNAIITNSLVCQMFYVTKVY